MLGDAVMVARVVELVRVVAVLCVCVDAELMGERRSECVESVELAAV